MAICLLALGSNLGDRLGILTTALRQLREHPQIQQVAASSWHSYPPIGGPGGQGAFLNGAARVETTLAPEPLRLVLHEIERLAGRERVIRWAERPLDIDLLLYDQRVIDTPALQVPHPRMTTRRFVLEPAAEVADQMLDPLTGWTITQLWSHLQLAPPYFALAGLQPNVARHVACAVRDRANAAAIVCPAESPVVGEALEPPLTIATRGERWQRALRRGLDQAKPGQTVISEFWLPQHLIEIAARQRQISTNTLTHDLETSTVVATGQGSGREQEGRSPLWAKPKLLVVLSYSQAALTPDDNVAPWLKGLTGDQRFALQTAIVESTRSRVECPALIVDAMSPDSAADDVVAAVQSMA